MTHPIPKTLVTAMLAAFAITAQAADGPTVTVSGFGTAGVTMTDNDQAEFIRPNQASGAGEDARTGVDSIFGIQATAKMNDRISLTAQGLARRQQRGHWGAELAWAFAKFKATDKLDIRVGRMGLPVYMISDFRNVGYANTMLRPPAEVYRQVTADSFDGADLVYQDTFGETTVTAQFGVGRTTSKTPNNVNVVFKPLTALHIVAEHGPMSFRFGRADADFSIENNTTLNGLVATLRQVGLTQAANDIAAQDVRGSFTSLGYTLDYKNVLVQAEYAVRKTDTRTVHDTTSYYAMLGYRFGKVTPYYYYGNIKQDDPRTYAGLPTTGPLAPLTAGVNSVVKAALQSTNAVGVRWDFSKSAALKVQVDHVSPKDGPGAFVNVKPGFKGPVNVYAAGIDFVF
ncbi:porin [Massilia sp. CF038]|uniref:porin n=1 Tax=Massilia sp. CF038 TaxID=1881045 RepID=UPI000921B3E3|nr:porin [Massilia sp. CF038]SHG99031.1 porin [Massilia sp. CF038]